MLTLTSGGMYRDDRKTVIYVNCNLGEQWPTKNKGIFEQSQMTGGDSMSVDNLSEGEEVPRVFHDERGEIGSALGLRFPTKPVIISSGT